MIKKSHLYPGFRHVGALASVSAQRQLQCSLIKHLTLNFTSQANLLSVGTAYGDELDFFAREGALNSYIQIVGIDIIGDVEKDILSQPNLARYHGRISFKQTDLKQLPFPFTKNYWDFIQCGFVLEDIEYQNKQNVYDRLFSSLKDGGTILISEMFLDNRKRENGTEDLRKHMVTDLYDKFLSEANDSLRNGSLSSEEYELLCGDDVMPGLHLTKTMSVNGERDFFETKEQFEVHLFDAGFQEITYHSNPINSFLGVIIARKRLSSGTR